MSNFHTILDKTHIFIGLLNSSGILLEANQTSLDFIGVDAAQVLGKPFWETPWWLGSPKSIKRHKKAIERGVDGEFSRFDAIHRGVGGKIINVDFTLTPIHDDRKIVQSFVVEGRDITDLKRTQRALAESEQRYRSLVEVSSDWYWEQDEQFRFVDISTNVELLTGTPAASHIGLRRWDFPSPDNENWDWSDHQACLARHESFKDYEYKRVSDSGDSVWLSTSGTPIFDANGVFIGYRGTSRNITEKKYSESVLMENELRLRLAVDIAGIGIWDWDMLSDQIIWDKKQFELFGLPYVDATIPLSTITDAIHPDDRDRLNSKAKKVLEEGDTAYEEFRIVRPDGSVRWLLGCSGVVHLNETGTSARLRCVIRKWRVNFVSVWPKVKASLLTAGYLLRRPHVIQDSADSVKNEQIAESK